jgi:hypothetical protein
MKKSVLLGLLLILTFSSFSQEKALKIYNGKFAFCGASGTKITKDTITVQGKKFIQGISVCPVMEGPSIANVMLVPNPSITPDGTDKTVWSFFWYYDTVPQAPTWKSLPTVNRSFIVTREPGGGMSNMFCMPCKVLPNKINGVTLAECYGPINEAAVPLRRAIRVHPGQKSITQAPLGALYPVGTIIPVTDIELLKK